MIDDYGHHKGSKKAVNAVTIQKIHSGVELGQDNCEPDAYFNDFSELKDLIKSLLKIDR